MKIPTFDREGYKRRLKLLRLMHNNETQEEFARRLGIPVKRWSSYEFGYPIPRDAAWAIYHQIGRGFIEWIWFGKKEGLDPADRSRVEAADAAMVEAERVRVKAKATEMRTRRRRRAPKKSNPSPVP